MKKTLRLTAFLLTFLMLLASFAACTEKTPANDEENKGNNEQTDKQDNEDKQNEEDDEQYADPNELVITDTFYPQYPVTTEYKDMKKVVRDWFTEKLESCELISASIGDTDAEALRARLKKDIKTSKDDGKHEHFEATYTDEASHIEFVLTGTLYFDYPAVDYVINVKNTSATEKTELISNLYALDTNFPLKSERGYTIETNRGSAEDIDDFLPVEKTLSKCSKGKGLSFKTSGGSSSNGTDPNGAFPFFGIEGKDSGIITAIGWSGQWQADFANEKVGYVDISTKQETFSAKLLPNETVRTPSVVLLYYTGEPEYGHNIWRKMIIEHYTPQNDPDNRFVSPICVNTWGGKLGTYMMNQMSGIGDIPADIFWVDAGWYGNMPAPSTPDGGVMQGNGDDAWHQFLGVWAENKNLFPNGIKEVFNYVHENTNLKNMLWWMIEDGRNKYANDLYFGSDSYYVTIVDEKTGKLDNGRVLRLDDDAVTDNLISYFKSYIDNNGMDCVRLDKSQQPLRAWTQNDANRSEGETGEAGVRQGITENKYIVNFYRVWDTLYEYYPKFMLDNCSSGGRRIDIEMTKRSIPLWRTDYTTSSEATQAMTQYLAKWIPLSASGVASGGAYTYRSLYSSSCCLSISSINGEGHDNAKKIGDEFASLRPYWYGSYYQILKPDHENSSWQAYELFRDDWQEGFLCAIRRGSVIGAQKIKLAGLKEDQTYRLHDIDDAEGANDIVKTGSEWMNDGMTLALPERTIKAYTISIELD